MFRNIIKSVVQRTFCRSKHKKSKYMKVTILGAKGRVGYPLALMLKQSKIVDDLALYDVTTTDGMGMDLANVDSKCEVYSYTGEGELEAALQDARVVVLAASSPRTLKQTIEERFSADCKIVQQLARACVKFCPYSMVTVVTDPINSFVPTVCEIFNLAGFPNTRNIFGLTTLDIVRARTFAAELYGLNPGEVYVPVIGGHSRDTTIPVLSQIRPCINMENSDVKHISCQVRNADIEVEMANKNGKGSAHAAAFAANKFVLSLVKGLCGYSDVIEFSYIRCDCVAEVDYFAVPLQLGQVGVQCIMGTPCLSDYETTLLDGALPFLREDIKRGQECVYEPCDPCDSGRGILPHSDVRTRCPSC